MRPRATTGTSLSASPAAAERNGLRSLSVLVATSANLPGGTEQNPIKIQIQSPLPPFTATRADAVRVQLAPGILPRSVQVRPAPGLEGQFEGFTSATGYTSSISGLQITGAISNPMCVDADLPVIPGSGDSGPLTCTLKVSSHPEYDDGDDDEHHCHKHHHHKHHCDYREADPNWIVIDAHHVRLRAEHADHHKDRTYKVTAVCTNSLGATVKQHVKVKVPHKKPK